MDEAKVQIRGFFWALRTTGMIEVLSVEDVPAMTRISHLLYDVRTSIIRLAIRVRKGDEHFILVLCYDAVTEFEAVECLLGKIERLMTNELVALWWVSDPNAFVSRYMLVPCEEM